MISLYDKKVLKIFIAFDILKYQQCLMNAY